MTDNYAFWEKYKPAKNREIYFKRKKELVFLKLFFFVSIPLIIFFCFFLLIASLITNFHYFNIGELLYLVFSIPLLLLLAPLILKELKKFEKLLIEDKKRLGIT